MDYPWQMGKKESIDSQQADLTEEGGNIMSIDRWIFRFAGTFIMVSLALSLLHHPYWLIFTAFMGANMFQASITGFCPMAKMLKRMGLEPGKAFE